ncbi:hypothetical protein TWF569_009448 [Orbilia oligospora]|uniref:Uncharacterized protein n=1 Tax=Orbilia oligospora TaxID=2813651 RepID=A0A7C8NL83_ORBOL|nr:hypothetical protein TWF103_002272 [Orbilia oligospora]KAF3092690.1 hypothetical protein TWF706_008991 [Orbilia oligospora]KAF3109126.1 hypothetical protein TWF102_009903 [Orbilia oligospora]KAF3127098.1 hypothetical protein TWF703_010046 [Orbilia oligospora]KAF3136456.1 hypothetical protein TWF569_009448 [Orbilia oligospora]
MKFIATAFTAVVGLSALAAARPQDTITNAPAPQATPAGFDAAYSSTLSCINACGPGNVHCQAGCQGLPVPDADALNATHDCVAACPPGGDDEKNAAWAICQQKCVSSLYYTASVPYSSYVPPTAAGFSSAPAAQTSAPAGTSGAAEETPEKESKTGPKETGSDASKTTGPAPTQSPNAGSYVIANVPLLGAFLLAAFAL